MALEDIDRQGALHARPAIDGSDIGKLTEADIPAIAHSLSRAFEDDPVMCWVFRETDRRARLERGFKLLLRRVWLRHGECYGLDSSLGAALWLPPDEWHLGPFRQLLLLPAMVVEIGRNLPRMMTVLNMMEKKHPREPAHFYLAVLGVSPELQGRGFGSALMQPVLRRCDRERIPAYLESSKRRNVVLYERHGFEVVEEVMVPDGGPPIWRMWREPR